VLPNWLITAVEVSPPAVKTSAEVVEATTTMMTSGALVTEKRVMRARNGGGNR
jgi:hypothetical protein